LRGEPAYFSDFGRNTHFPRAPIALAEGLRAASSFPILLGGEVLGIIEFFSREMPPRDPDLLNMMSAIDSQLGQFMERKRAEEALQQAHTELSHLTRVTTLGELTASIAHEINQPLSAVLTNANASLRWLAGDSPNLDETREAIRRVIRDGSRANEIVGRIRALARKALPQPGWLDLNQAIWEITAILRSEIHRSRVSLQTQLATNLPALWGDRIQLQQVGQAKCAPGSRLRLRLAHPRTRKRSTIGSSPKTLLPDSIRTIRKDHKDHKDRKDLTQSRRRLISPFSYVGQGRKGAKVRTKTGIAAKNAKRGNHDARRQAASFTFYFSPLTFHPLPFAPLREFFSVFAEPPAKLGSVVF
jgi:hypothetical protein